MTSTVDIITRLQEAAEEQSEWLEDGELAYSEAMGTEPSRGPLSDLLTEAARTLMDYKAAMNRLFDENKKLSLDRATLKGELEAIEAIYNDDRRCWGMGED